MAILKFPIGQLVIILDKLSYSKSRKYFDTQIGLTINWLSSSVKLQNSNKISLTEQDVSRLTAMLESFIHSCVNIDECIVNESKLSNSVFAPLELGFTISCLDGDVDQDFNGEITLKIMLNSDIVDYSYSSNYVGVEVNVNSLEVLEFCEALKKEAHCGFVS